MKDFCKIASLHTVLIYLLLLYPVALFGEGFIAGTLVKTVHGLIPIEQIKVDDVVICRNHIGQFVESHVTAVHIQRSYQQRLFILNKTVLVADAAQRISVSPGNIWVRADKICAGDLLASADEYLVVQEVYEIERPVNVYQISVHDHHNFLVSDDEVVVHNLIVAVPVAAPVATGTVVALTKVVVGVGMVAGWAYTLFCAPESKSFDKKNDDNRGSGGQPCRCGHTCGVGCNCGCFCGCGIRTIVKPGQPELGYTYANGRYVGANYHHANSKGNANNGKSPAPIDGQKALDNSIQMSDGSPRRIGVSCGQIVVLSQTSPGQFHGHIVTLKELQSTDHFAGLVAKMKQANLLDRKGKPLQ